MATADRFDGFTINVYQDDEGDYLAHFVELPSVSAFAATPEEALNELAEAWAGIRESYEKRGERGLQLNSLFVRYSSARLLTCSPIER